MHEVAVAQNIIEVIEEELKRNNLTKVNYVKVLIGEFTGIVKESLDFALNIIKMNTVAQNAEFSIDTIKLKTKCNMCKKTFVYIESFNFLCPICEKELEITAGKEMRIDFMDVE